MEPVLSVSLVRNCRIIDVRTVRRGGTLRVPRSCPARLELGAESDELGQVIFDFRERDPVMSLPEGVSGEIASGTEPRAVHAGTIALDSDVRGWLDLGESTLLVQRLPPSPPAPRARLPAAVRSPWARLERPLAITLAAALAAEVILVVLVHRHPEPPLEEEPGWPPSAPVAHVIPPPVVPAAKPPKTKVSVRSPPRRAREGAQGPGHAASDAAHQRMLQIAVLFGAPELFDQPTVPGLQQAFERMGEMKDRVADVTLEAHRRAAEADGPVGIGNPWGGIDGPRDRPGLVEHPVRHPPGPIALPPPPPPEPTGPDDDYAHILRAVHARSPGIQHCYEIGLRLNQRLSGKVLIEMNVVKAGTVSEVEFPENRLADESVMDCLGRTIRSWRLPALTAHDELDVEFPFVFTPAAGL